ncbi:hypothetical protein Tco_1138685 [Tanacetum coccineum]
MYRLTYEPPSPSTQPNQVYSPLNRLNLDMDLENLFSTQEYYAGQCSGNDYYEGQGSGNDYYAGQGSGHDYYAGQGSGGNQDYSMGHGSVPVEDGSPIEEVKVPAKGKKVSKHRQKTAQPKETFKTSPWTIAEEVALSGSDEEVRKVRPMGRDQARKKKSSTSSRSEASSTAE